MFKITKDSVVLYNAVPDVFIKHKLLMRLVESGEVRVAFLKYIGKSEAVVELYKEENGGYITSVVADTEIPEDNELEGAGFYEKLEH